MVGRPAGKGKRRTAPSWSWSTWRTNATTGLVTRGILRRWNQCPACRKSRRRVRQLSAHIREGGLRSPPKSTKGTAARWDDDWRRPECGPGPGAKGRSEEGQCGRSAALSVAERRPPSPSRRGVSSPPAPPRRAARTLARFPGSGWRRGRGTSPPHPQWLRLHRNPAPRPLAARGAAQPHRSSQGW